MQGKVSSEVLAEYRVVTTDLPSLRGYMRGVMFRQVSVVSREVRYIGTYKVAYAGSRLRLLPPEEWMRGW